MKNGKIVNFNVVTMEEVIDAVEGKSEIPNAELLIAFDVNKIH